MKNLKIPIFIASISLLLAVLNSFAIISVGAMINRIAPCAQDPGNSFPCFGMYDVTFDAITFMIFVASTTYVLYEKIRKKK